ncbi:LysR family transcriptional regulator [Xenorhabdus bovienii]|uniref:LysR family transcriptional regulator n=1 Tax=Xenorhabdus bovienii TaxID=40576 RepID=UPI001EDEF3DB|nr:LysR family transcriptional regulator [Xenorhabdus bovienii]MCG3469476.1 LysR family transcriptional regulator [Xenorhabdus bovienii]
MMNNQLNRIQTFIAVVDCGSFTRAAERLLISKAMTSIHVKRLEESLNVPLLIRNSRGVALTEAGQLLYNEFSEIFINIQSSLDNVAEQYLSLSGTLRITSTIEFGDRFLLPLIGEFCKIHPQLNISYNAGSALNDLISDRLDLAIRLGVLRDSSLKSRKIADYKIYLVASPDWLEKNKLESVNDLRGVDWIANSNLQTPTHWELSHLTLPSIDIRAKARFNTNSSTSIKTMAIAGFGVTVLPEWMIETELKSGNLVRLFPEYSLPKQPVTIVFPNGHKIQRKCRVFIDYLVEKIKL